MEVNWTDSFLKSVYYIRFNTFVPRCIMHHPGIEDA